MKKKKGHCKQRDKGCMMTLLEHQAASESRSVLSDFFQPHGLSMDSPWNSPSQNTGVGRLSLLQRIFPNQGWNPGLPHCRQILYQLSHKGSPRTLEWGAYPFSFRSSQHRSPTFQVDSLPAEPQGKPKNTGVDSLSLLHRISLTQGSNQGLVRCRFFTS